jgi:hypothetical protein
MGRSAPSDCAFVGRDKNAVKATATIKPRVKSQTVKKRVFVDMVPPDFPYLVYFTMISLATMPSLG